ncbi:hypothetical protein [Leifsonia sp. Root227]|uniref:hypothetical protein n=1 Tax=Leifsonia sp. Root227 TaxID=1736496 RepID=UPI000AE82E7A|nr:hypothetical protein [Leifsonia sp. Root227]
MDAEAFIVKKLNGIPDVARRTGTFVGLSNGFAVVNVGNTTITVPCVGFTPPVPGIVVQLERRNGQWVVLGPAVALNPIGTIKAGGSPYATVTVDGTDYVLGYRSSYTPTIGNSVEINWATGIIQGAVTVAPSGSADPNPGAAPTPLSFDPVLASDSGQFRSRWQSNDVRASDSVSGAWFYNGRVSAALAGATVTSIEIYLPLRQALGVCNVGTHGSPTMPGSYTGINGAIPLDPRGGWVALPLSFVAALAAGGGIAVSSGNGDNQWSGTQADRLSGALRFRGTH